MIAMQIVGMCGKRLLTALKAKLSILRLSPLFNPKAFKSVSFLLRSSCSSLFGMCGTNGDVLECDETLHIITPSFPGLK